MVERSEECLRDQLQIANATDWFINAPEVLLEWCRELLLHPSRGDGATGWAGILERNIKLATGKLAFSAP